MTPFCPCPTMPCPASPGPPRQECECSINNYSEHIKELTVFQMCLFQFMFPVGFFPTFGFNFIFFFAVKSLELTSRQVTEVSVELDEPFPEEVAPAQAPHGNMEVLAITGKSCKKSPGNLPELYTMIGDEWELIFGVPHRRFMLIFISFRGGNDS